MWLGLLACLFTVVSFITAKTVDLSFRGLKKEDFFIKIQQQITLTEITDLNLSGNQFDSFLDCSTNLEMLRTLDLSQNHLQRFFFLCKDEYNLQMLNVSHNMLEYIDDNSLNDRVTKLKILDLSYNRLTIVNETMLEHLTMLECLSLSHNPIGDGIHNGAFWNLKALKHLDMRNISAPFFSGDFFKTLTNLSNLDISWNPISTIPLLPVKLQQLDLSGTQVISLENLYLPQLQELKMEHMPNLTSLALNDLENLTSLESLSMVGCRRLIQLRLWPQNGVMLPRLQRLSIKESGLTTLGVELSALIQRVPVVEVVNNPWKCDCKMEWIDMLNSTRNLSRDIRCHTPDRLYNKLLAEIPSYELQCEHDTPIFYPILWTSVSILIVALILAAVFMLLRRPMGQWSFRGRDRDTVTYTSVVESNNDLVRILAVTESQDHKEADHE
ncbi:leucine-rich repeat neuronal protein 3-like isoform X2 [Odontomachus brunneus]|uniref:leucine-rich repeat neuronal protein 3-like isoform X2 n=1 Tax=Odontomachus brunneus TaxID=486640 RepID=UPI0013F1A734|nr:leucine-rich repeat neuronal protein 3-like isoform X2 [Odontomachus brunneus]